MKKFFLFLLTLSAIAFASCSSDDNYVGLETANGTEVADSAMQQVKRNAELIALQNSVHDFNVATFTEQQYPETRNWLKKFFRKALKIVATVAADALGGVVGGVAGGVTASGIVGGALLFNVHRVAVVPMPAAETRAGVNGNGSFTNLPFTGVVPTGPVCTGDSIGYYHNKVMGKLFSDTIKVAEFNAKSDNEKAQLIVRTMKEEPYLCNYYGAELDNTAKINQGVEIANKMMQIADEAETEEEFFAMMEQAGFTDSNVMAVLREILQGLDSLDIEEDNGEYYEAVLDIINRSGLDEVTKQSMEDGVIIGQSSNRLWKGTLQINGKLHSRRRGPTTDEKNRQCSFFL